VQLNTGKFAENGKSGYVLKPLIMTDPSKTFDPFEVLAIEHVIPLSVTVQVGSAAASSRHLALGVCWPGKGIEGQHNANRKEGRAATDSGWHLTGAVRHAR
jgi:hypothetical protein